MKRSDQYRAKHQAASAKADALLAVVAEANGEMTADQSKELDTLKADMSRYAALITHERTVEEAERFAPAAVPTVTNVVDNEVAKPFASLGEQLVAVVQAGMPGGTVDKRLFAASGGSANVGNEGGFLIQKDFAPDLVKDAYNDSVLAGLCSSTEISAQSDGLEVPYVDETSRATGSRWGGVQVYRRDEADTVTATKPKIGKWELRLEDMMGLAYLTERLMLDAPAMAGVFTEAFTDEFGFKLDDEIFRGTGVGQCLGVLNADCTVSVAKETGQAAATIVADNVIKMWSRVLPRSKSRGVWVVNAECGPQLQKMYIATGVAGQLVYLPAGGLSGSPNASLFGRPVYEIEQSSALGTVGDIAFLDLSQYKLIRKGGTRQDESIHVRFLYAERTLRWITRVNGAPKLKSAITPYKGSNTLSPFVTLATRS